MQKQAEAHSDPRLYVSWFSGTIEDANPSLNGPLGPTRADIEDAQCSLPSWIFRRLYLNLPGQPDCAAFDFDSIEACIMKDRTMLPPQDGVQYVAFVDMSGGGSDDATLSIAHHCDGRAVLDLVLDQGVRIRRTFSMEDTVKKFVAVLQQYRCTQVTGDNYAKAWPQQMFEKLGVAYRVSDLNRSQLYAGVEPLVNSGTVQLLDSPKLLAQFVGLIRKEGGRIDHGSNEHDDHCNSASGALLLVSAVQQRGFSVDLEGF